LVPVIIFQSFILGIYQGPRVGFAGVALQTPPDFLVRFWVGDPLGQVAKHFGVEFGLQFAFVTVCYYQFAFIELDPLWDGVQWVGDTVHATAVSQEHIPAVLFHNLLVVEVKYSKIGSAFYTSFAIHANSAVFKAGVAIVKCVIVILTRLADFLASGGRILPFVFRRIAMILITVFWRLPIALITTLMAS
jgi:hypothetical protein